MWGVHHRQTVRAGEEYMWGGGVTRVSVDTLVVRVRIHSWLGADVSAPALGRARCGGSAS
jgi:hypothetical protein